MVVASRGRAEPRRCPTPSYARTASRSRRAACSTSTRSADQLVACGYERVDQVEDRGQFAIRGDILDVYPATEERAVRCELFDVEVERLTWFSTFTQRSLEEAERVEIAPAAELGPEHRELAEIAAGDRRVTSARTWPRCCRSTASASCSTWSRRTRSWPSPPRRSCRPRSRDLLGGRDRQRSTTRTPTTSTSRPDRLEGVAGRARAPAPVEHPQDQPHEFRAQSADTAARSLREAEPELEKLVRSGYRTIVAWARRGEAERAALQPGPRAGRLPRRQARPERAGRCCSPTPACARASWRRS